MASHVFRNVEPPQATTVTVRLTAHQGAEAKGFMLRNVKSDDDLLGSSADVDFALNTEH